MDNKEMREFAIKCQVQICLVPRGTKFLREFIFVDWRFFVFCGNSFLRLGQIGFSCWKLIFAIFQTVPSTQH